MIDLPEETFMTAGLDVWPSETSQSQIKEAVLNDTTIRDERLELRLTKTLGRPIKFFLSPTVGRSPFTYTEPPQNQHMKFYRFPSWLHCPNCKVLQYFPLDYWKVPRCTNPNRLFDGTGKMCSSMKKGPIMKPVRFLMACPDGHIDDFPWVRWVHEENEENENNCDGGSGDLYLLSSAQADLSGVYVKCKKCGKERSLASAKNKQTLKKVLYDKKCTGRSPWLGRNHQNDDCSSDPQLVFRASSSIYFANTVSSILIPPYSKAINIFLNNNRRLWTQIEESMMDNATIVGEELEINKSGENFLRREAVRAGFDEDIFIETVTKKYLNQTPNARSLEDVDDEKFRFKEYIAFASNVRPALEDRNDFDIYPCDMSRYQPWITEYFIKIIRVERLKETRAFTGFSRIIPTNPGEEKVLINREDKVWLPAVEVRGEGIFLEFNPEKINEWNNLFKEYGQGKKLDKQIKNNLSQNKPNFTRRSGVNDTMMMVHSFAHLFIRQLAFECGYDASSLKERLFVGKDGDQEMCGVLIYTASGDSEGSLGGLVERARPGLIENTIRSAVEEANFCSNDPICHETDQQGLEGFNVSACHSCLLLPETSCEHNNLLLDRRTIIGTFDNPEVGYFSDLINI